MKLKQIIKTLERYNRLSERRYKGGSGGYSACDSLMELERVFNAVTLTDRQREVMRLYYLREMTQEEVASHIGITRQAVGEIIQTAYKRIEKTLEKTEGTE